jgi:hypothetical protein
MPNSKANEEIPIFSRHYLGKENNFFHGSRTIETKEYTKTGGGRHNPV